jgi:hypothetical protein
MVGYCRVCWQEWRVRAIGPRPSPFCPHCQSADVRYAEPVIRPLADEELEELDDPPPPDGP